MQVNFTDVDEFLDELRKDAGAVDRGIVRVTHLYRTTLLPMIRSFVVATARVGDTVLQLEIGCGELLGHGGGEHNDKTHASAAKIKAELEAGAHQLGLEVRAGMLTNHEENP